MAQQATLNAEQLRNANVNLNQYWDDSNLQNQVSTTGWELGKHTWEWVKTSNIDYNQNVTTDKLQGNMIFGNEAQNYNSNNEWYIAKRNDAIASGLYNEWKTSREDVANYLQSQEWFMNSSEEDRNNTIESVWRRLWGEATATPQEPTAETVAPNKDDYLPKNWLVYGKAWSHADGQFAQSDLRWTQAYMEAEARYEKDMEIYNKSKMLAMMSSSDLASSIVNGSLSFSDSALQNLTSANPELMKQIQEEVKKKQTLTMINEISTGAKQETDTPTGNSNSENLAFYQKKVEDINNTIMNLESEIRRTVRPWTPEHIIQAKLHNRTKNLLMQQQGYMSSYNMFKSMYEHEIQQEDREFDRWYKEEQLQIQKSNNALSWAKFNAEQEGSWWSGLLDPEQAQEYITGWLDAFTSQYEIWSKWGQCGSFVNDYLESMWLGRLFGNEIEQKKAQINSQIPTVGSIAVFEGWNQPQYGHVAIVTGYDPETWMITTLESNKAGEGQVFSRTLPASSAVGYFNASDQLVKASSQMKDSYLQRIRMGNLTNTEMTDIQKMAQKEGRLWDFNEALSKGMSENLTTAQQTKLDNLTKSFNSNAVVKTFEESVQQYGNLLAGLNAESWPWDMAWVFAFMKTLDPTSVVRESEFEAAARSAGVKEEVSNIWKKISEWKILTPKQSEEFKKIAEAFIKAKAVVYETKYNDTTKLLKQNNIPETYRPTNMADVLREQFLTNDLQDQAKALNEWEM